MRSTLFLALLISFIVFSCQKDKLKGDSEILVGNWEWQYSIKNWNVCNPPSFTDSLHSGTENVSYQLEFEEKGHVIFKENSAEINKYWIDLLINETESSDSIYDYSFTIYLDGQFENVLSDRVGKEVLMIKDGYPFVDTQCALYTS